MAPELLQQEPDYSSPEYQRVNKRLRGIFAEAAINKAAQEGGPLHAALECLATDTERTALRLDFRNCSGELRAFSGWAGWGQMQALEHLTVEGELTFLPEGGC